MTPAELLFWGMTLTVTGKVLVIVAALFIHASILKEKKIDKKLLSDYRKERWVVVLGLLMIVVGYILELRGLGFFLP